MELTERQEQAAEAAAEAIVAAARAQYPDDPDRFVRCALYGALHLVASIPACICEVPPTEDGNAMIMNRHCPVHGFPVSNESPSMTPAELELRLSSPGAKWGA